MACCLMAQSHYLNQYWLIIKKSLQEIPQPLITDNSLKIIHLKFHQNLPGANELNNYFTYEAPGHKLILKEPWYFLGFWSVIFSECHLICKYQHFLTHSGRVMHICVSKLTSIGSDNGLSPGRCQAIIWTNVGISLIQILGSNFSKIIIEIRIFLLTKTPLKMSSGKWWPFCLGLNVLKVKDILKIDVNEMK